MRASSDPSRRSYSASRRYGRLALIGAGLGLPLGVLLASAVTHALSRCGVGFELSAAMLAKFVVVALLAGRLAAIAPARRASRPNVLTALQYE